MRVEIPTYTNVRSRIIINQKSLSLYLFISPERKSTYFLLVSVQYNQNIRASERASVMWERQHNFFVLYTEWYNMINIISILSNADIYIFTHILISVTYTHRRKRKGERPSEGASAQSLLPSAVRRVSERLPFRQKSITYIRMMLRSLHDVIVTGCSGLPVGLLAAAPVGWLAGWLAPGRGAVSSSIECDMLYRLRCVCVYTYVSPLLFFSGARSRKAATKGALLLSSEERREKKKESGDRAGQDSQEREEQVDRFPRRMMAI
jgi:hypothetical protein